MTSEEARYVHKRVRHLLGLRGRPARLRRLPEILTREELRRILAQAYQERGGYGLIVRTLFEPGLRVSELVRLEATDVDFAERTIRVRQGKGGKDRLVLFTEDLGQQLRLHLDGLLRGFVFESNRAAAFSPRRIQQIVKAVAHKAGVPKKVHRHSYRRSMATFLRNQGVPLDVVQLLLGHSDPKTTQLYARLSLAPARREDDRAMAALAAGPASTSARTMSESIASSPSTRLGSGHHLRRDRLGHPRWAPRIPAPAGGRRCREFDATIVPGVDHLARSVKQLTKSFEQVRRWAAALVSITDDIDTSGPAGGQVFHVMAVIRRFEGALAGDRIRAGLRRARAAGTRVGQPRAPVDSEQVLALRAAGLSYPTIGRRLLISPALAHRLA